MKEKLAYARSEVGKQNGWVFMGRKGPYPVFSQYDKAYEKIKKQ